MDFNNLLQKFTARSITVIAVAFCLFHLYTAATGPLTAFEQRVVHLTFGLMLVFLAVPLTSRLEGAWRLVDWFFCLVALTAGAYLYLSAEDIAFRLGIPNVTDIAAGMAVVLLLLEATRRVLGWPLPIIALSAILYAYFGNLLPGLLSHGGFTTERIVSHLTLTTEGIFTIPLGVSATVVVIFILFATFLNHTGWGSTSSTWS